ncbi:MAG: DUF6775 family putative metallopeptidase [Armatimonadota bacterium]|jgi:hypothetical protein
MIDTLDAIYIYDAPDAIGLNIGVVAQYLAELLPEVQVHTRTDFFTYHLGRFDPSQVDVLTGEIAARLEEREVHNLVSPALRDEMAPLTPEDRDLGVVYLAGPLQDVMGPLLLEEERGESHLHIVHITQAIGRFQAGEPLLRLQIMQHGQPTVISTTGFVEVPELPREYTFRRAQLLAFGMDDAAEDLDGRYADETLGHGDTRVTRVAVGHALQAVFRRWLGEGSCDDPSCPLHRARTHDELFTAHLSEESGLCDRHARMLIEARRAGHAR